ncbi:MAG: hypothetical protein L6Q57_02850 [Alphaproteobacteria bacterium]|nr:hypothetical protein [Alphaproteobacteria bacterium]
MSLEKYASSRLGALVRLGWVYGGQSPSTQQPFLIAASDYRCFTTPTEAATIANSKGVRLMTPEEFQYFIDTFPHTGLGTTINRSECYWVAATDPTSGEPIMYARRFKVGPPHQIGIARFVCDSEPRPGV